MTYRESEKAVKLFAAIVLGVSLLIILLTTGTANAQSGLTYHKKLQKERSFETWEKNQPKVRLKAVKNAVEQSKEIKGSNNKLSKLKRKEARIRERIIKES